MIPYRSNQRYGVHPYIAATSRTSGLQFWGHALLGQMGPIQASVDGRQWSPCLTQVIESPWTEDEWEIPIDTDNVYAVRTRCWHHEDGGEVDWLTFVPRVLPDGYEAKGRCGHVVPLIQDFLGPNPFAGVVDEFDVQVPVYWRTKTGLGPSEDGYLWTPMNLNQQVYETTINDNPLGGTWYVEDLDPGPSFDLSFWYKKTYGPHIGFRAARITGITYISATAGVPNPCLTNIRLVIGWTDPDDPDPVHVSDLNILYDHTFTGGSMTDNNGPIAGFPFSHAWDINVSGPLCAPTLGKRMKFHLALNHHTPSGGGTNGYNGTDFYVHLGPRHDVPLWYWASERNRVAPGGIVIP